MYIKQRGLTEKTYLLTDITSSSENPVSVVIKAKLMAVEVDGKTCWIPLITQPDMNNRTETELAKTLGDWLD